MGWSAADLTSRVLRHERALVAVTVITLVALGWWYIGVRSGASTTAMAGMTPPPLSALVLMWWLMMVAMMLPSATPAVLLYSRVRQTRGRDSTIAQTWVFLAGYLAMWLMFSVAAAVAQRALTGPSMALGNGVAQSIVLLAAGLYQLSPLKSSCVRQCRSPARVLAQNWRPGVAGAIRLGSLHGVHCLGCCCMLMALLFVGGVMNLLWVIGLTLLVAVEKLAPYGDRIGRAAGVALVAWGMLKLSGL